MVPPVHNEPAPASRRLRILVVDDERMVRAAVVRILKNHDVTAACSAEEAVRVLAAGTFDVVVTDNRMSNNETGVWLLIQARERWPSVRRVLMSGTAVPDLDAHLREGLVHVFVPKPLDHASFLAIVAAR